MAKGISIGVVADTKPYLDGIKSGVIKPTQDAQKALDAVGKTGEQAGDKLETALKGQQTQTKANAAEYKKLAQTIQQSERQATQQVSLSTGQRTKLARSSIKQAGAAASQQASAGLQQIGGTISGAISGIGNTVGGILASFGPAGIAIGSAVAIGVGLVTSGVQEQEKAVAELKSKFSDLYKSAAQDGRDYLTEAQIQAGVLADTFDDDKRIDAAKKAADLNVTVTQYNRAQNGDQKALNEVIKQGNKTLDERGRIEAENAGRGRAAQNNGANEADATTRRTLDTLKKTKDIQDQNANAAKRYSTELQGNTEDAAKVRAAVAGIPQKKTVKITADTAQLGKDIDKELRKKRTINARYPTRNGQRYV